MVSFLLLLFGIVDVIASLSIILGSELIFPQIAKIIGIALLAKGVWCIVVAWMLH